MIFGITIIALACHTTYARITILENVFTYDENNHVISPSDADGALSADDIYECLKLADSVGGISYYNSTVVSLALEDWFGTEVELQNDTVRGYRRQNQVSTAVSFKLITIPTANNFAIVSVRGTVNNWDLLEDAQIWGGAALLQFLREMLPLGRVCITSIQAQCLLVD